MYFQFETTICIISDYLYPVPGLSVSAFRFNLYPTIMYETRHSFAGNYKFLYFSLIRICEHLYTGWSIENETEQFLYKSTVACVKFGEVWNTKSFGRTTIYILDAKLTVRTKLWLPELVVTLAQEPIAKEFSQDYGVWSANELARTSESC